MREGDGRGHYIGHTTEKEGGRPPFFVNTLLQRLGYLQKYIFRARTGDHQQ